jgi:hypothetical protein
MFKNCIPGKLDTDITHILIKTVTASVVQKHYESYSRTKIITLILDNVKFQSVLNSTYIIYDSEPTTLACCYHFISQRNEMDFKSFTSYEHRIPNLIATLSDTSIYPPSQSYTYEESYKYDTTFVVK